MKSQIASYRTEQLTVAFKKEESQLKIENQSEIDLIEKTHDKELSKKKQQAAEIIESKF